MTPDNNPNRELWQFWATLIAGAAIMLGLIAWDCMQPFRPDSRWP